MKQSLLSILRAPKSKLPLTLYEFVSDTPVRQGGEREILEGILLTDDRIAAYPIVDGVPIMFESAFTHAFLQKHAVAIASHPVLSKLHLPAQRKLFWSFSDEWNQYFNTNLDKTWGWTVAERLQQFYLETGVDADWCKGKLILDAGCGNGQLSEGLSRLGANVIGVDYAESVFAAALRSHSDTVHFVQGDLQTPPFQAGTFDLIISNGVLHHSPNTYRTFVEVSQLVKEEGRLYLWLYRRSKKLKMRLFIHPAIELMRAFVSRASPAAQKLIVKSYTFVLFALHKLSGSSGDFSWREQLVSAYDTLTPRWRHYHAPLEVSCWFFLNGYSAPAITHWDNPYGFGMVAEKKAQADTPGINFRKTAAERHWK
jgi:2-polyprenyl-3-methyl-5-hydroxy-6-metoxy-1,4-benzoquinol methylase/uncharacterized protein YbaR (Trm112 family)